MQTHNANIIKHEARDRVVYKVFFFVTVFAVSATWLDHYCVYVWEWERRRKGMHSETKNFTVWITGYTSPDEPRPILWARSPAEGSGSGAGWAKKAPYSSGEWLCWLEPEPIEELSWPHTFSQPGAPALITRLGHANIWYQHNTALCYCQTGFCVCACISIIGLLSHFSKFDHMRVLSVCCIDVVYICGVKKILKV